MNNYVEPTPTTDQSPLDVDQIITQVDGLFAFDSKLDIAPNQSKFFSLLTAGKRTQHMVFMSDLRVMDGFNPRVKDSAYYAHIRNIANSIKEEGFYADKPLTAVPSYEGRNPVALITDGGCRFEAAKLAISEGAELNQLPVVFKDRATTQDDLMIALVKSNEGKRFTPLELSIVVKRLYKFGHVPNNIARRLGFTPEYVHQLLALAGAPDEIRRMLESGVVSAGLAVQAMRKHGSDATEVLMQAAEKAKGKGKSSITTKDMPDHLDRKVLIKTAPAMKDALDRIRSNEQFESLPEAIRQEIENVLADFSKEKAKAASKAEKSQVAKEAKQAKPGRQKKVVQTS